MRPKNLGGLGFRDMEIFNLALLSRQAWWILQNPTSLSARILKADYFPDYSILDASIGTHPSQIWRAIVDGRDILAQGLIKRIGTGETTQIWSGNWLPRQDIMKPITSLVNPPLPRVLVSQLMEPATAQWNENLVRTVFVPIDAEAILGIPLCTRRVADFWAWGKDPRGIFSVKSCYKMIVHTKRTRENWLYEHQGSSKKMLKTTLVPHSRVFVSRQKSKPSCRGLRRIMFRRGKCFISDTSKQILLVRSMAEWIHGGMHLWTATRPKALVRWRVMSCFMQ